MDSLWIFVALIIVVLFTMMVRIMVMRRSFKRSYPAERKNAPKGYFDRNRNCTSYTLQQLEKLKGEKRILTRLHIPREGLALRVEILMVHMTGIYVFEIKDYGGQLAGEQDSPFWTIVFENGRTETFPNPVLQGRGVLNALEEILPDIPQNLLYLYVVFGQRCELKQVPDPTAGTVVLKRNDLLQTLNHDIATRLELLSLQQMDELYEKLKDFTSLGRSKALPE